MINPLSPMMVVDLLCYIRRDATNASVEWVFAKHVKLAEQEAFVQEVTESWKIACSISASYPWRSNKNQLP